MSRSRFKLVLAGAGALLAMASTLPEAAACGGFFCSQSQPVNQAAERIVFAKNGDGTVTAVIQILYEGPSENFSWLLPISSVPQGDDIAVASDLAFMRLQAFTNPQYTLVTRVEGRCLDTNSRAGGGVLVNAPSAEDGNQGEPGVKVEASGVVGAFEWTVISLNASLADPAGAAVAWLGDNGYDVPPGAPSLLGPYLEEGLYLLALRLTKGADSGSIRPIVLTYDGERPAIPIKLTQVAANDDMGVMTWLLGDARAVPQNYLSLELNEARINWLNPNSNYNDVVIEAANATGTGQGFVTEYSQPASALANAVFTESDQLSWNDFPTNVPERWDAMLWYAYIRWGTWDGFWDAVRAVVPFDDQAIATYESCPDCFQDDTTVVSPAVFTSALETNVIEPMRVVQRLIDAHPQVTRLYTTLSAAEMTTDPVFTFNPDLPDVTNVHTAERVIRCDAETGLMTNEAPWEVALPQGGTVRGTGSVDSGPIWPASLAALPATLRIRQMGESGDGRVLEDNSELIRLQLDGQPSADTERSGGCSSSSRGRSSSGGAALIALGLIAGLLRRRQIWPQRG